MKRPLLAAAASLILSQPVFAQPVGACAPEARQAAMAHIERTPAIGQVTSPGSAFALDPRRLRFEVDVFGPQTYVYRVDVTVDRRCNATDFDTQLLNNPWGGAW